MRCTTVAVVIVLVAAVAAAQTTAPPRPLHKVGDHWTPWDCPQEHPEGTQVHIIQPGDTLWDLAAKYLGNPYLWPQIWENNRCILDAHWIYPGDPLVIVVKKVEEAVEPVPTAEPEPVGEPAEEPDGLLPDEDLTGGAGEAAELIAVGGEDDVYCFAYLGEENREPDLTIASAEEIGLQMSYAPGDVVYLSRGEAEGVSAGQEFFIVAPDRAVRHPATRTVLGVAIRQLGHLRVLCAQEHTATAEILAACDPVPLGAWLEPFDPIPLPMTVKTPPTERCDPPSGRAKGFIVYAKDDTITLGSDHMVMLDLGEADQVVPGTVLTAYRENPVAGMPRIMLGEVAVLRAADHWSTGKIIRSEQPLEVGDRVEVK